jgi:ABC-type transport system substrate-binding protein
VRVSQTTAKPSANQGGFGKLGVDLIFVLVIPYLLLQPKFPGMNFGFKDLIGSSITAYIVAALVPVTYTLIDVARTRVLNPITILAGSGALIGGALAFFQLTGATYALKDSYHSIFLALVMGGSLLIGRPFFRVFFQSAMAPNTPDHKSMLERLFSHPRVRLALTLATIVILLEAVLIGTLNFIVNYATVVDKVFGSEVFNQQVANANAIMRLPSLISSLISFGLAFYLVTQGVSKAFPGVDLFEDHFWDSLAKAQNPQPEAANAVLEPTEPTAV